MYLSRIEIDIVTAITSGAVDRAKQIAESIGSKRERREIEDKLKKLGFTIPWQS